MKIIKNLLIWALLFLPATIWWIKSSCNQFNSMQSWADTMACFIMWIITIGIIGFDVISFSIIVSGGDLTFVF